MQQGWLTFRSDHGIFSRNPSARAKCGNDAAQRVLSDLNTLLDYEACDPVQQ
jgi:hypothetical protein